MFDDYPEILSVEEVAEILRIGERSVYDLLKRKRLAGFILKNKWIIPRKAIEQFLSENAFGKTEGR